MFFLNKQKGSAVLIGLIMQLPIIAIAQDLSASSLCPIRMFKSQQGAVKVWQEQFEDGVFDLVMAPAIEDSASALVRLSFGGSNEAKCHFPEVSVLKGGDWGWHIVWTSINQQAVFYARVDAEAWVSSPPKKIDNQVADVLQLSEEHRRLWIKYHLRATPSHENHVLVSEDEGRNFSVLDKK